MQENRIKWIDVAKGIGIICVIIGHMGIPSFISKYIYSFHMPLFFFISGYVFKFKDIDIFEFIKIKSNRLLKPYLYFSFIIIIMWFFINNDWNGLRLGLYYTLVGEGGGIALWFLVCLFNVEIIFFIVFKLVRNNFYRDIILIALGISSYILSVFKIYIPYKLNVTGTAIIFYTIGYYINNYKINSNVAIKLKSKFIFVLIVIINIYTCYFNNTGTIGHVDMNTNFYGNVLYFYISALSGIYLIVKISKSIENISILKYLGINSLIILCIHGQIPELIRIFIQLTFGLSDASISSSTLIKISYRIISFILIPLCIYIINKYFKFLIGKDNKNLIRSKIIN